GKWQVGKWQVGKWQVGKWRVGKWQVGKWRVASGEWRGGKPAIRNSQIWFMAALMIAPAALYYFAGARESSANYLNAWTIFANWREIVSPSFYTRWMIWVQSLFGLSVIFTAFFGALVAKPRDRALLISLWIGYGLHGVFFPRQTPTHDYYHIVLIPIIGLSLAPVADLLIARIREQDKWAQALLAGATLLAIAYPTWMARSILLSKDFGEATPYWEIVGNAIPAGEKTIGATQNYGMRLMYYGWRKVELWPRSGKIDDLENAKDAHYFVITAKNQVRGEVLDHLEANYPVLADEGGYVIYDLRP
ncbi:MAG: hypothetical protein ACE5GO_10720, partial [Anaerolineales bacterium]